MRLILYLILTTFLFSCSKPELNTGAWRGIIEMQGQDMPMNFDILRDETGYQIVIKNLEERITLDEVRIIEDSIIMFMHIFDTEIHAKIGDQTLQGYYVKNYEKDFKLPFYAELGPTYRFVDPTKSANEDFSGKYSVTFRGEKDTTAAVGIFQQVGNKLSGTFLTTIGDYRYLEGNVVDGEMMLSTFDGNHAFVFRAKKSEDENLIGDFYSGKYSYESWIGVKDDNARLPDAEALTYLKKGFDKIDFQFPDLDGNMISPSDEMYKNKVLILQIFGSWCPNCMDETKFLTQWYKKNSHRGVEILGLAYEAKADFVYASARVKKMKDKLDVPYNFVIAGTKDKKQAAETLPMLNHVLSFPTTIFIGKDGVVKRIHTGFTGPGTGIYYEQFIDSFNQTIDELLAENITSIQ